MGYLPVFVSFVGKSCEITCNFLGAAGFYRA